MKKKVLPWLNLGALFAAGLIVPLNSLADGNIVQNGGFNSPNGGSIPGWTYPGYLWNPGYPPGADGGPFVGVSRYISQALPTQPGQSYFLQFTIRATIPSIGQTGPYGIGVSWDSESPTIYNMTGPLDAWITENQVLTASSATTILEFTQPYGATPYLDAVSVTAIPEPRALFLVAVGLGLVTRFRLRSAQSAGCSGRRVGTPYRSHNIASCCL